MVAETKAEQYLREHGSASPHLIMVLAGDAQITFAQIDSVANAATELLNDPTPSGEIVGHVHNLLEVIRIVAKRGLVQGEAIELADRAQRREVAV